MKRHSSLARRRSRATRRALCPSLALILILSTGCSLINSIPDDVSSGSREGGTPRSLATDDASASAPNDGGSVLDTRPSEAESDASLAYAAAVMEDQPMAFFRFNEPPPNVNELNGQEAVDHAGRTSGVYMGPIKRVAGVAGSRGILFDNEAQVVVPGSEFGFPGRAALTVEIWFKPGSFTDYEWIASTEVASTSARTGWALLGFASGRVFYEGYGLLDGGPNFRGIGIDGPVDGTKFQHFVVTYDSMTLRSFLNGVIVQEYADETPLTTAGDLVVGCSKRHGQCLHGWTLDEFALYDHPLRAPRVQTHYRLGRVD